MLPACPRLLVLTISCSLDLPVCYAQCVFQEKHVPRVSVSCWSADSPGRLPGGLGGRKPLDLKMNFTKRFFIQRCIKFHMCTLLFPTKLEQILMHSENKVPNLERTVKAKSVKNSSLGMWEDKTSNKQQNCGRFRGSTWGVPMDGRSLGSSPVW